MQCLQLILLLTFSVLSIAADTTSRSTITTNSLRVCADPNNLPFSNEESQGFENKIIELISTKLDKPVHYTWFPQTIGYIRNTLQINECDLISGITTTNERVQNTNPYYRSIYSLVYAKKTGPLPLDFSDPFYKDKIIGVVAGTPAASLMAKYGLLSQVKPYQLIVDTRYVSIGKKIVDDIEASVIDAAIIWGPIAGYYAGQAIEEMAVVPLVQEAKSLALDFRISMAVRYNDQDWKQQINEILAEKENEIITILNEYKVPLLDNLGQLIRN